MEKKTMRDVIDEYQKQHELVLQTWQKEQTDAFNDYYATLRKAVNDLDDRQQKSFEAYVTQLDALNNQMHVERALRNSMFVGETNNQAPPVIAAPAA